MRGRLAVVAFALSACGFEHGVLLGSAGDAAIADAREDGAAVDVAPGTITYVSYNVGRSTNGTVAVAANVLAGATYVLAVSSKPYSPVGSVSGLGATWTRVADQCGARSQTGAAIYVGRDALVAGDIVASMTTVPANTLAIVALYTGSTSDGAFAVYNALDATTCSAMNMNIDIDAYAFSIGATSHVVAAIATRAADHTAGTGLVQRVQETQGSSGDAAGLAIVDGRVTEVAGTFSNTVDVAAVAIELRP